MAYETNTASGMQDLLSKLSTFAQAQGWTQDVFDTVTNFHLALHKGTVFVQFKYDTSTGHIAMYQSTAYSGAAPGGQTNDSGNGDVSGPVDTGRMISGIGNTAYTAYHFFASSTDIHVVLEWQPGLYRHFSFGQVVKVGNWTGGEYVSGHMWFPGFTDALLDPRHSFLFDARNQDDSSVCTTVHCEGLPDQAGSSKWGVVWGGILASVGNDRGGNSRMNLAGGIRGGFWQEAMGWLQANPANGYIPMFPIAFYLRKNTVTPEEWRLLGYMPDVRYVNTTFINPGEEFTIGGVVWKCFPWVRKNELTPGQQGSGHMGVAYKKVV